MFIVKEEICEHGETFHEELSQPGRQNMQELFFIIFFQLRINKNYIFN